MESTAKPFLIVTTGHLRCALPLEHVAETMRPYRVSYGDGPGGIVGSAQVRGRQVPVIDLMRALGGESSPEENKRLVRMKLDDSQETALLVSTVVGSRLLQTKDLGSLSPVADVDPKLLHVLRASGTVNDRVWSHAADTSMHGSVAD